MLALLGLDHRRADVATRGRLSFAGDSLIAALRALSALPAIAETVVLSTCNRTEVYLASPDPDAALAAAFAFMEAIAAHPLVARRSPSSASLRSAQDLTAALYTISGVDAVAHLYHVAAGLRSMVIGESQILGQVRDAFMTAEELSVCGEELRAAFTGALHLGKRVRAETGLGRSDASVASVAVFAARRGLGSLAGASVTLVGAGQTSALAASLLREAGVGHLTIANRNLASAQALAARHSASAISLETARDAILASDALITATAAPYAIILPPMIAPREPSRPLLIIDLAVPADVAPEIGAQPGVTLLNLDALHDLPGNALEEPAITAALAGRQADITDAERLIEQMLREYTTAQTLRLAAPGIAALRRHVDASQEQELARALAQLSHLSDQDQVIIQRFGARLVDKMFHHLVRRIRTLAEYDEIPPETTMRVLTQLFSRGDERQAEPEN